jgi:ATP-dependent Zn protease
MNLVNEAYEDCVQVLESYQEALEAATDELLRGEQLTGQRLEEIMKVRGRGLLGFADALSRACFGS